MIREARIEDLKEVCDMGWELNKLHAQIDELMKPKEKAYKKYEEAYLKWIEDENYFFLIAEDNNNVAGYVIGKIEENEPIYEIEKKGLVIALYVKPEFRKKGLMRLLMDEISLKFKNEGIIFISLLVHSKFEAVDAWKKLGFQVNTHLMTKKLLK